MVNKPMIGVAAAVVVVAAGVALLPAQPRRPAPRAGSRAAALRRRRPRSRQSNIPCRRQRDAASKGPLPSLADSDPAIRDALGGVAGSDAVMQYLVPDSIIRHIVVTIDNLPRQKVPVDKRPTVAGGGQLSWRTAMSCMPRSIRRISRATSPWWPWCATSTCSGSPAVYLHFYPLFQQVYQNLGYPNGYFNDRLVQVIDSLLATPQPAGPIELTRPNVMYTYRRSGARSAPRGAEAAAADGSGQCGGDQGEAHGIARDHHRGAAAQAVTRIKR